jgi:hypothetical protein
MPAKMLPATMAGTPVQRITIGAVAFIWSFVEVLSD